MLHCIDVDAAAALAVEKGELHVSGLTSLSDAAAQAVAKLSKVLSDFWARLQKGQLADAM
jgi:hypothetical protein